MFRITKKPRGWIVEVETNQGKTTLSNNTFTLT